MASSSASSTMKLSLKPGFSKPDGPVALIIMDGVGQAPDTKWNAFTQARTPFLDKLMSSQGPDNHPALFVELDASGKSVGLPSMGDMGNSEVGHNALGAGRVFDQGAKLVNNAFRSGDFRTDVWRWLMEPVAEGSTFHLIGLYSDGNVHSHVNHVFQLIDAAVEDGAKRIRVHVLADGRDVGERSALDYFGPLEKRLQAVRDSGVDARVASGGGRMHVTMDRYEADWRIVQRGWATHVLADTDNFRTFSSACKAVETLYKEDDSVTDQYLPPFVIVDNNGDAVGPVRDNDSVLFWNFRGDRAIEISKAFEADEGEFPHFDRKRVPKMRYAGMMQYDGDAGIPARFLVSPPSISRTVGEYVVKNGLKRYSVSETQKYGHVTYFYNGNRAAKFDENLEKYTCIPSYLEREHTRPWMRAAEISDEILKELDSFKPDLMVINYANGDMVGHTGHMVAARLGMECLDLCLARVVPQIAKRGGVVVITADHGNCDIMADVGKDGKPKPGNQPEGWKAMVSHTKQPVPCVFTGAGIEKYEIDESARWSSDPVCKRPGIVNLASTVLNLLGLEAPEDFTPSVLKVKQ